MRNHNEKARDMARSVLPSTARKGARETRANIHSRERAHERQLLHDLRRCIEPDDFDGDLGVASRHRRDVADMVDDRRAADKVGPLIVWAERLVERNTVLSSATPEDREVYFRKILPPGLIGNHAISHLYWVLDDRRGRWSRARRRTENARNPDVTIVEAIIAAGRHGDLNRRLRAQLDRVVTHTVRLPPERLIDDDHPAPGVLLRYRSVTEYRRRYIRFLAGAHDAEAFVKDADWEVLKVVRSFHADITGADNAEGRPA
jgi:hypothetical protein